MRFLRILVRLRARAREFFSLEPLATIVEEPVLPEPEEEASDRLGEEFQELLAELGAENQEPDYATELARKDGTIAELQAMLNGLRGLGDLLAESEKRRLATEARVAALESELVQAREDLARLPDFDERQLRELEKREAVLAKERERHAATREKLSERKRVAAERWRELQQLRSEVRRLELSLADLKSRSEAPAPLPAPVEDTRTPLSHLMQDDPAARAPAPAPE